MGIEIYRVAGGCIGEVYRCKTCGYSGSFIIEEEEPSGNTGKKS